MKKVLLVFAVSGVALLVGGPRACGAYGIREPNSQAARLPAKVDLVPDFEQLGFSPRRQGARDDCSLFAVTALAEFECARDANAAAPRAGLSPEFLIWAAHEACGHKGDQAMFYEAVGGLNALGICSDEWMLYEQTADPQRKPSAKAMADAASRRARWQVHWIKRWDVQCPLSDAELGAIKSALAEGHPVACGLRWPVSMAGYEILSVPPPGKVRDGHSIAFVGYEDDPNKNGGGTFVFRNSDGPKWGKGGYGVMSYAYVRAYANDALWLHFGPPHSEKPVERFAAASLAVLAHGRCAAARQDMSQWGGPLWTRGAQLFCNAHDGGFVELGLAVRTAGRYRLRVLATAAPDYGVVRGALDGKRLGHDFDLYSGRVCPAGSLELGTLDLATGEHRLRFTSVGKQAGSTGFSFGLDAIDLLPPP
jgi:hypothetical protein